MASIDSIMYIPSSKIIQLTQLSFRKPVLFYLKTNADPRLLLKLMQISRYFCFKEFPYMVVEELKYVIRQWYYFQLGKHQDGYQKLDLDNLTKPLWITNKLFIGCDENVISLLLSKMAVCSIKKLDIRWQNVKMDEFKILVSSKTVKNFNFCRSQVVYDDGSIVPIDEIVKLLPNLKIFACDPNGGITFKFTPKSTAKLIEYLNPYILTYFELNRIPETFNFKLFAEFMDKNPSILFTLRFDYVLLSDEYTKLLQAYVYKLNDNKNRKIFIDFPLKKRVRQTQTRTFFNIA